MGLVILFGASGAGKTSIARAFSAAQPSVAEVCFFDSIGVPSSEEMAARYGSGEGWQEAMTAEWLARIAVRLKAGSNVLFEGQTRPSFVAGGALAAGIGEFKMVLVDCDDETRARRLGEQRGQPELATASMMNWARFLRDEAGRGGHLILNTSVMPIAAAVATVRTMFHQV